MKKILLLFVFFTLVTKCFSTEQFCDLLIIGRDTIYLKSFPLEKLKLSVAPFKYGNVTSPNTGCWRGYIAIWLIRNDSLFLIKILSCEHGLSNLSREKNIFNYFNENNERYYTTDKMIFASWYTADLVKYDLYPKGGTVNKIFKKDRHQYLYEKWNTQKREIILIHFEKGLITKNNINVP